MYMGCMRRVGLTVGAGLLVLVAGVSGARDEAAAARARRVGDVRRVPGLAAAERMLCLGHWWPGTA